MRRLVSAFVMLASPAWAQSSADPALHWRLLGPFRGGWATMVEGIPARPDSFYFAAAGGGLWRTDDAGRSWAPRFTDGPPALGALAIAPSDPDTLYIGTGQPEPRYDVAAGGGVFRSSDGGRHWTSLGLADTRYIGKIWVDPANPDVVLVGAQGHFFGPSGARGVYRSTDGGKTWSHPLAIDDWTGVVDIAADPKNPAVVYAAAWEARQYPWQSYFTPVVGSGSAIYKSTDEGAHWQRLGGAGWPGGALGRISLAVAGARVYASVDAAPDSHARGLYRSDDGGGQWRRVNEGESFTGYYASRLTLAPGDPDTIYTVGQSIRRCTKGGAACEIIKGAPGGDDYHHIWINPLHPDHMITGSDQGAVVSVDGGRSWSSWYNQPTGQFYHLAADNRFPYWVYSGQQDSGTVAMASRSDYGALTFRDWHPVGGDERDYDIPDPADPGIVYGSGLGGRVTKWSAATGQIQNISPWPVSSYGKRPTEVKYHYLWVTPLVAGRVGPAALYLGAQVLFRSTDRGESWAVISPDLSGKRDGARHCGQIPTPEEAKACGYGAISVIEPSPGAAGEIWIGTDSGVMARTVDGGAHWRDVTPAGLAAWGRVASIDVSAVEKNTAYVVIDAQRLDDFTPHVLRTTDGGQSWQPITVGLPGDQFASVVRSDPRKAGLLYAGTERGVFVSFDDGGRWQTLQNDFPAAWVRDLLVHGDDLIAATQGRGIWVLDDVTPLRQMDGAPGGGVRLFSPAVALRVHPDNNADTPLPPEEPQGENPPAGAVIDYAIGPGVRGPVSLEVVDGTGATVRRWRSGVAEKLPEAERYFAASWVRPPVALAAGEGLHRFAWDLRTDRPEAANFSYGIAAVAGRDTPIVPLGPFVLPGTYTLRLRAGAQVASAQLEVKEDPRLRVRSADLAASAALSRRIVAALGQTRAGCAEVQFVKERLAGSPHDAVGAMPDFNAIDVELGTVESDLEAADGLPTKGQRAVVDDALAQLATAQARWLAFKTSRLPLINTARARSGKEVVTIPHADQLKISPSGAGEEMP